MTVRARQMLIMAALFAVAVTARLVALFHEIPDFRADGYVAQDEREYDGLARSIMNQGEFRQSEPRQGLRRLPRSGEPTAFRTPGTPVILATIHTVFGGGPAVARVVLAIGNSLAAPLLFWLCLLLRLRPLIAALLGGVWAVAPTSLAMSFILYGEEPSCVILLAVTILAVVADRRRSLPLVVAAGLLLGFGIITRGFLLFIPFTLGAWLVLRRHRELVVGLLLASAIIPGIWLARNVRTMGLWALSTESWEAVWLGNNQWARGGWPANWPDQHEMLLQRYPDFDQRDELGQAKVFELEAKADLRNHPQRFLWLLPRKAAVFFWPRSWLGTDWAFALMLPLFAVGAISLWRSRQSLHLLALIGLPIASVFGVSLLAFSDVRYRHPMDTMVFVVAGFGLERLAERRRFGRRAAVQAQLEPAVAPPA